jgi:hypothetical protein
MIFDKKLKAYLETDFNIYDLYRNSMRLTKEIAENFLKVIFQNKAFEPNCTKMSALNSITHDARKEIMKYRIKKLIQILYQNQKRKLLLRDWNYQRQFLINKKSNGLRISLFDMSRFLFLIIRISS